MADYPTTAGELSNWSEPLFQYELINPDRVHTASKELARFFDVTRYPDGHHNIVKALVDLVGEAPRQGERYVKQCANLLICYAQASLGSSFWGSTAPFTKALFDPAPSSCVGLRLLQESALTSLRLWADNGDSSAIEILQDERLLVVLHASLLRYHRHILAGISGFAPVRVRSPLGDNAKGTTEARDEIDKLLEEKHNNEDVRAKLLGAARKTVEEALPALDNPFKGWVEVEFPKVPDSSYLGVMERVFGIHPRLALGFVEAIRVKSLDVLPANNLKTVNIADVHLRAVGQDFWVVVITLGEGWGVRGAVRKIDHQP